MITDAIAETKEQAAMQLEMNILLFALSDHTIAGSTRTSPHICTVLEWEADLICWAYHSGMNAL